MNSDEEDDEQTVEESQITTEISQEPQPPQSDFLDFDQALSKVCSKPCDRFQWIAAIGILLGITSFDWILFAMQFLEKMPNYLCLYDENTFSDNWQECDREKICQDIE